MAHSSLRVEFDMVFDQTRFKSLATHFNISMFGLQTMFDDVWSPNISRNLILIDHVIYFFFFYAFFYHLFIACKFCFVLTYEITFKFKENW